MLHDERRGAGRAGVGDPGWSSGQGCVGCDLGPLRLCSLGLGALWAGLQVLRQLAQGGTLMEWAADSR